MCVPCSGFRKKSKEKMINKREQIRYDIIIINANDDASLSASGRATSAHGFSSKGNGSEDDVCVLCKFLNNNNKKKK